MSTAMANGEDEFTRRLPFCCTPLRLKPLNFSIFDVLIDLCLTACVGTALRLVGT